MLRTDICDRLGIEYPILLAGMGGVSMHQLTAAVSNAGGLGVLGGATVDGERLRREIRQTRELTDKPFAVNLNLFPAMRPLDNREYMEVIYQEGIKIVETSGHRAPEELAKDLKEHGVTLVHKCVGVRYALKAQSVGVDAVTVVGF